MCQTATGQESVPTLTCLCFCLNHSSLLSLVRLAVMWPSHSTSLLSECSAGFSHGSGSVREWVCASPNEYFPPLPSPSSPSLASLELVWGFMSGTHTQHCSVHTVTSQLLHRLYLSHNNTSSVTNLVTTFSEEIIKTSSRTWMLGCYLVARICCAVAALGILLVCSGCMLEGFRWLLYWPRSKEPIRNKYDPKYDSGPF